MKISKNGIELIKKFEGCRLDSYKALSSERYYTIGYGHYSVDVKEDMVITQEQADIMLIKDLEKYESKVMKYNGIYKWNQNEFDALVSFAFNVGSIDLLTCDGRRSKHSIACAIGKYNKSGGVFVAGLYERRLKERELFLTPCKEKGIKHIELSYIVKKGDTLTSIAKHYHTTVDKLVKYNEIKDANNLFVGELIKIK